MRYMKMSTIPFTSMSWKDLGEGVGSFFALMALTPVISLIGGPIYCLMIQDWSGYTFLIPFRGVGYFLACLILGVMGIGCASFFICFPALFIFLCVLSFCPCESRDISSKGENSTRVMERERLLYPDGLREDLPSPSAIIVSSIQEPSSGVFDERE